MKLKGCDLVGEGVSLGPSNGLSEDIFRHYPLHPMCGSRCELLVTTPARCLPAWCHASYLDGQRLSHSETQINSFIFTLPWSYEEDRVKASQQLHFETEWR